MGSQLIMSVVCTTGYIGPRARRRNQNAVPGEHGSASLLRASLLRGPVWGLCPKWGPGQSPWWEVNGRSHSPTEAESNLKCRHCAHWKWSAAW